jgi:hypothetical protein
VHAEYNRHGVDPKEINLPGPDGVLTRARVFPDIIVHQVGHDAENILVIEAKKTSNRAPDEPDLDKLRLIKHSMNYRHAVFLRLPTGQGTRPENDRIRWV